MRTIRRFRREVPEIPRSRRFVAEALAATGARPNRDVLLVASELVTNAVRHGSGDVELRLELRGADVRIEVVDDGHVDVAVPAPAPSPAEVGGRGLHLVRAVARRWGSGLDPTGRFRVWAELSSGEPPRS